jgi:hypothetical protein
MYEKWIIAKETGGSSLPPIKHKRRCCSVERRIDSRKCIVNMSHQVVFLGICLIALEIIQTAKLVEGLDLLTS